MSTNLLRNGFFCVLLMLMQRAYCSPLPADPKTVSVTGENGVVYKKYHIIDHSKVTFQGASTACESSNSSYVSASIKNQKEFDLLSAHLTEYYEDPVRFWTSGNDLDIEGEYYWGSKDSYAKISPPWWWEGEPSGAKKGKTEEHCIELVQLDRGSKPGYKLNDAPCFHKKYPICEEVIGLPVKSDDPVSADPKTLPVTGENGVVYKKYHIIDDSRVSFHGASKACESSNSSYVLASIKNQKEFDLLSAHLTEYYKITDRFWTSGNDLDIEGEFYWGPKDSYAKISPPWWWEGEPNNAKKGKIHEHCIELVQYYKGSKLEFKLNDAPCRNRKYPICEEVIGLPVKSDDPVSADPKTLSVTGENGVVYKKYHIIDDSRVTFHGASKVCESSNSSYVLASIKNQKEFDLLSAHLTEYYKITDQFWTSGNDLDIEGEYYWGPKDSYAKISPQWWWEGEPNNGKKIKVHEHCIELIQYYKGSKLEFKLNDAPCHHKKYSICEERIQQSSPTKNPVETDYSVVIEVIISQ